MAIHFNAVKAILWMVAGWVFSVAAVQFALLSGDTGLFAAFGIDPHWIFKVVVLLGLSIYYGALIRIAYQRGKRGY